jgi:hypothetical protein
MSGAIVRNEAFTIENYNRLTATSSLIKSFNVVDVEGVKDKGY